MYVVPGCRRVCTSGGGHRPEMVAGTPARAVPQAAAPGEHGEAGHGDARSRGRGTQVVLGGEEVRCILHVQWNLYTGTPHKLYCT